MVETTPMSMCPMAETCKGMMEKQILAWLIAIALVVMGIAMLMMTKFMRGIRKRIQ
jgi:uncharacterized membrane protein HdeD (DUF308 family)